MNALCGVPGSGDLRGGAGGRAGGRRGAGSGVGGGEWKIPLQLEENHVVPLSSQDEALASYSVSGEALRSILKFKTIFGNLDDGFTLRKNKIQTPFHGLRHPTESGSCVPL